MEGRLVIHTPASPLPRPRELRRLRRTQSLTQTQLAARLRVSLETVRDWETGLTTPRGRRRKRYARLLTAWAAQETPGDMTPRQAFDTLHESCAPALVRQAYLLTGRPELARESAERAFRLAWRYWPEMAIAPDPQGWVRSTTHGWALSPWQRLRPRHLRPAPSPADPSDRALMRALLALPRAHRRTVVLHDMAGLGLPETATETGADASAAAGRLLWAHETLSALVPEQAMPEVLPRRLGELASSERLRAVRLPSVRSGDERSPRHWVRAAIVVTTTIVGATTLTLQLTPHHQERPPARGTAFQGIPARVLLGPPSGVQPRHRSLLAARGHHRPERLVPEAR
ncbi:helix-turn-helix domain-containing protein [Streptomyces nodosus]|uniref:helix-turn-helix domain-containing protein n=1 Tax=Streptomyces nodosus TaxID=40318 RepID=UPI00382B1300